MDSGVKEIKDVLKAVLALSAFIIERAKDGLGVDDALALVAKLQSDAAFASEMKLAFDEIGKVPQELSSLTLAESLDIIVAVVPDVMNLVSKFQSKPAA